MKRIITTTIFALIFGLNLSAQSDGFFSYNNVDEKRTTGEWGVAPALPVYHNMETDVDAAPVGNGIAVLAILGLAYGVKKRKSINQ
ncbi:MAG: hypothetical protein IKW54_04905 [Bacteroidales bacterium]|nr:hypothetical protein [Bacteroidales bacterium]